MHILGVGSLVEIGEVGDVQAIRAAFGNVAGFHSGGWAGYHQGTLRLGLLLPAKALVPYTFLRRLGDVTRAAAAAAAALGADAPVPLVLAVPFKDWLAKAGYTVSHPTCRPSQEMVNAVLTKAKSTKRVAPFLDARVSPFCDVAWTKDGKTDVQATIEHAAATTDTAIDWGLSASTLVAHTALV